MGLGNRTARQHETVRTAGVDPADFWDFKPGQAVMTVDGFSGKVTAVNDGPLAGTESYQVMLDGGLGGGEYTANQLTAKAEAAQYTAAQDYPELADILVERPDIAINTKWASRKTAGDEHWDWGVEMCPECHGPVDTNRGESMSDHLEHEHGLDANDYHQPGGVQSQWEKRASFRDEPRDGNSHRQGPHGIESFDELKPNDGAEPGVDEHGHLTWDGKSPACRDTDEYSMFGQNDAVKQAAFYTADELRAVGEAEEQRLGMSAEDILRSQASGECMCGHGGHTQDQHEQWAEANNRDAWGRPKMQPYDGHGAWDCNNYDCTEHPQSMYEQGGVQGTPGWLSHDAHPDAEVRRQVNQAMPRSDTEDANWLLRQQHTGPSKFSALDVVVAAADDSDFRFEVTAAWSDVRAKAKRIRAEGGVHVVMATQGMVHAEVKGDHHVYETGIQRLPGRHAIASWACGCKWGAYHWGAEDDMSRFAGRMCSHALALQFEVQARGMFGRDVHVDDSKPSWVPRMVVVKHDIDSGKDIRGVPTRMDFSHSAALAAPPIGYVVAAARGAEDPADFALLLSTAGITLQSALRAEAAVNNAWGEPQATPVTPAAGPTKPNNPMDNPASSGWASNPDPESWSQAGPSGLTHMVSSRQEDDEALFEPELGKEAFLPLLIPLAEGLAGAGAGAAAAGGAEVAGAGAARAIVPKVLEKAAPRVLTHEVLKGMDHQDDAGSAPAGPKGPSGPAAPQPGPAHGPGDDDNNPLNYGARADLHEEPEGALPSTDGDLEPEDESFVSTGSVDDIVRQFQATAAAGSLGGGSGGGGVNSIEGQRKENSDIAAAAKAFLETGQMPGAETTTLQTVALKDFSPAEQKQIIDEGANVRAANFDRLDIRGTHYEPLEAALAAAEGNDDEEWMS